MKMEQIGPRLKAVRKALGFSVADLVAEGVGISVNQFHMIERGDSKANIEFIARICYEYDISIDSLVYDTDEQFEELLNDLRGVVVCDTSS